MPNPFHIPQCNHIKPNGQRCGSPALKRQFYCFFHHRQLRGHAIRPGRPTPPPVPLDDPNAIQASLTDIFHALHTGSLDYPRASLLLRTLTLARQNSRRVLPNYHAQP